MLWFDVAVKIFLHLVLGLSIMITAFSIFEKGQKHRLEFAGVTLILVVCLIAVRRFW